MAGRRNSKMSATTVVMGLCGLAFLSYLVFVAVWNPGSQLASLPPPVASAASPSLRGATEDQATAGPPAKGPPTRRELGHGTWGLLHRMAAKYPTDPTQQDKENIVNFLHLLGQLFPCEDCAGHFRGMLQQHPPQVGNNLEYSLWLCKVHNIVNERVGNPTFECDKDALQERWGDCGCFDGVESESGAGE